MKCIDCEKPIQFGGLCERCRSERQEYLEAEIEEADLDGPAAHLALSSAGSALEENDRDTFEQMVSDCIQGANESNPREKGDDDGVEYADPRDARDERRFDE